MHSISSCICRTPDVSEMHADTSAELNVVAAILHQVLEVSNVVVPLAPALSSLLVYPLETLA